MHRVGSIFSHQAERHARGFSCWSQFIARMFCQLGRAHSLREICGGLAAYEGKLKHFGLSDSPRRWTLSYAHEHRPWELYRDLFCQLVKRCQVEAGSRPRHKFRCKNKLVSIDGSTVSLCVSMFDWAHFQRAKGAVKLHLLLDHDGYLPCFAVRHRRFRQRVCRRCLVDAVKPATGFLCDAAAGRRQTGSRRGAQHPATTPASAGGRWAAKGPHCAAFESTTRHGTGNWFSLPITRSWRRPPLPLFTGNAGRSRRFSKV